MANEAFSTIPAAWYRPVRVAMADWSRAHPGRLPSPELLALIGTQVTEAIKAVQRQDEQLFEMHHGLLDLMIEKGRGPTQAEAQAIIKKSVETVQRHIHEYYENKSGILGSIADIFTAPAKGAVEKAVKAATGRDIHVTSLSVSPKQLLDAAQAVISFVPGVGAGINAAIAAGEALANGENITDALADVAKSALPGGPLAHAGFDAAYKVVRAAATGGNVGDAVLASAREALPGDAAKKAFDVGLAVAHGQNVQDALKDGVTDLVKAQAGKAVEALSHAALPLVLTKATQLLPPEVTRVATAIQNTPGLRSLPVAEIAKTLGVDPSVASQASGVVSAVWEKIGKLTPAEQKALVAWGERSAAHHPSVKQKLTRALLSVKETKPLTKAEQDAKVAWGKIAKIAQDAKSSDPRVRAQAEKDAKILSVVANARKNIVHHMAKHGGGTPGVLIDGKGRQIKGRFVLNATAPEAILYTRKGTREGRFVKIA